MDKFNLPKLDRLVEFDERSRRFSAVEGLEELPLQSKRWYCNLNLDQGSEGACVGFAWTHELAARPKQVIRDKNFALAVYNRARQLDYWDGEDYSGTSVLAGIKAVMEIENSFGNPLIKEYRWAFGTEDVIRTLSHRGPVVLGIEWHNSMYYPDDTGRIRYDGDVVGGHAILAKAVKLSWVDPEGPATYDNIAKGLSFVKLHNSWGEDWGINGDAWMSLNDLNYLLDRDGEACIPLKRSADI
jgi:hypothetical protein